MIFRDEVKKEMKILLGLYDVSEKPLPMGIGAMDGMKLDANRIKDSESRLLKLLFDKTI